MPTRNPSEALIGVQEIARATGRTTRWVQMLAKDQGIEKDGRGRYPIGDLLRGLVHHCEAMVDNSSRSTAAAEVTQVRADEIQQRIAMRDRTLISIDETLQALDIVVGTVNADLTRLPARVTRDVVLRRKLEVEVHESKGRICGALERAKTAAQTGKALDEG